MADKLYPLKQRAITGYQQFPVPDGSILLIPNREVEPPDPPPPPPPIDYELIFAVDTTVRIPDVTIQNNVANFEIQYTVRMDDKTSERDVWGIDGGNNYIAWTVPSDMWMLRAGAPGAMATFAHQEAVQYDVSELSDGAGGITITLSGLGSDSISQATTPETGTLQIGGSSRTPGGIGWIGLIKDFKILVGGVVQHHWPLDEGPGETVAVDVVGGKNGVIDLGAGQWVEEGTPPAPEPEPPSVQQQKKWNPGYYMTLSWRDTEPQKAALRRSYVQAEVAETKIIGFTDIWRWVFLEGARGDYGPGLSNIAADLSIAEDNGKRYIFGWGGDSFNIGDVGIFYPQYIIDGGHFTNTGNKFSWNFWDDTVRGWWKDMIAEFGAQFDGHPALEGWIFNQETAHGNQLATIISAQTFIDSYKDMMSAVAAAFPTTNTSMVCNSNGWDIMPGGSLSVNEALWDHAETIGMSCGARDGAPQTVNGNPNGPIEIPHSTSGDNNYFWELTRGNHRQLNKTPYFLGIEASQLGAGAVAEYNGYDKSVLQEWHVDWAKPSHALLFRRAWDYADHFSRQWQWNQDGVDGGHNIKADLINFQDLDPQGMLYPYPWSIDVTVGVSGADYGFRTSPALGAVSPADYQGQAITELKVNAGSTLVEFEMGGAQLPGIDTLYMTYTDTVLGSDRTVVLSWSAGKYTATDAQFTTELQMATTLEVRFTLKP